jgi:putative addiction module component (TIGR02574 family)
MSTADIRDAAMKLTPEKKARLAEDLLASLDAPNQSGIDAAWGEEAERRIDALDAGHTKPIPADDVFRDLERRKGAVRVLA